MVICPKDSKKICGKNDVICENCEGKEYINKDGYFRKCNICKGSGKAKFENIEYSCTACGHSGWVHYVNRNDFTSIKLR